MKPDIMRELQSAAIRGGPLDTLTVEDIEALHDGDALVVTDQGSPEEWLFAGNPAGVER